MITRRLGPEDTEAAARLFDAMAETFGEARLPLRGEYLKSLLARPGFWALAAFDGDEVLGGLTAHTLPMTRSEASELFIFDLAVRTEHQRRGIGRALIGTLRTLAADEDIDMVFVSADNDDTEALDFYRAVGGVAEEAAIFTFSHKRA